MCTLTIKRTEKLLLATMTRDERRTRAPEIPPTIHNDRVRWVAPLDSEAGGTWVGVNEHSITAFLLNTYEEEESPLLNPKSRGMIVPEVLQKTSVQEVELFLNGEFDPLLFRGFTLVVASFSQIVVWTRKADGSFPSTELSGDWALQTSSSWNKEEVLPWRQQAFDGWLQSGASFVEGVPSFHLLQPEGLSHTSPLMARELSASRSISQLRIEQNGSDAEFRYWQISPDSQVNLGAPQTLSLPQSAHTALSSAGLDEQS